MQNNSKEAFSALSEKYKKELMEYYRHYRPAVVPIKDSPSPQSSTLQTESENQNKEQPGSKEESARQTVEPTVGAAVFSDVETADSDKGNKISVEPLQDASASISLNFSGKQRNFTSTEPDKNVTDVFAAEEAVSPATEVPASSQQTTESDTKSNPVQGSGQPVFSEEGARSANAAASPESGGSGNLDDIDMDMIPIRSAQTPEGSMSTADRYDAQEEDFDTFTGEGYLSVQVVTANGALPVQGAVVTIKKEEDGKIVYENTLLTNESGNTETVTLPTPKKSLSENPEFSDIPYADYQVQVTAESYMTVIVEKVPVFSGILSIQPVSLIPGVGIMTNRRGVE